MLNAFRNNATFVVRIIILCALFFFMAHRLIFFKPGLLESAAACLVYPFIQLQKSFVNPLTAFLTHQQARAELEQKIMHLHKEKKELLARVVALDSALWYEKKTQAVYHFLERYKLEESPCVHIIMKQKSPQEHSFLIDYGSRHGAQVDMVVAYNNCILGRVVHVYPYYSKVISCADPFCKIPVYCNMSHAKGIYEGTGATHEGTLRFVSHLEHLIPHELVITSGEGIIFPEGFAVGTLTWFERDGLYYNVGVKPLLSLEEIEYCYVLHKGAVLHPR